MKTSLKQTLAIAAAGFLSASVSFATPTYTTFGNLAGATFGGTGNPTDPVAITTGGGITLGLAAQQRNVGPNLSSSAGTYYAPAGQVGIGSKWNFDFYIGGTGIGAYNYSISYGLVGGTVYSFNPLSDVDAVTAYNNTGAYQDSQNLLFATFGGPLGAINSFAGSFNPNADATYDFLLTATPKTGGQALQSGITVVVGNGSSVPDTGSTVALMGVAFAGIAGLRRKFLA